MIVANSICIAGAAMLVGLPNDNKVSKDAFGHEEAHD
jgi:hypothetical protein